MPMAGEAVWFTETLRERTEYSSARWSGRRYDSFATAGKIAASSLQ
jgi:hypothetical protein